VLTVSKAIINRTKKLLSLEWLILLGIVLGGVALRLQGWDSPLLSLDSWRQCDTAAIARNFYRHGYRLLYPEIDWAGGGYVEMNFPLFEYLVAILYRLFGLHDSIGRLLAISFSAGSMVMLYALVKKFIDTKVALFSTFFFVIAPISVYYDQAFMPEAAMIFFSIALVFWFSEWLDRETWPTFALAALCGALAFLIKIPTLHMGLPLLWLCIVKYGKRLFKEWRLWLFACCVLLPTALWYYHARQLFLETGRTFMWGGYKAYMGNPQVWLGIAESPQGNLVFNNLFYKRMYERLTTIVLTLPGFVLALFGSLLQIKNRREYLFHFWALAVVAYLFIMARSNIVQVYYQIPVVPVGAVFVGRALGFLAEKRGTTSKIFHDWLPYAMCAMSIITLLFASYQQFAPLFRWDEWYDSPALFAAANAAEELTEPGSLLIVTHGFGTAEPTLLYLSDRKGWHIPPHEWSKEVIEGLKVEGAGYFITTWMGILAENEGFRKYLNSENELLVSTEQYVIYKLSPARKK